MSAASHKNSFPEGVLKQGEKGQSACVCAVNNVCIVCKQPVTGWMLVQGFPYHGVTHWACRPFVPTDGDWPHDQPAAFYKDLDEHKDF